jgi:hypothetical protein
MVATAVAFACRRHPLHGICIAIALWVLIPSVAAHHLVASGGALGAHPATWLLLAQVAMALLFDPVPLARAFTRHLPIFLVASLFVVGAYVTSKLNGYGGIKLLLDQTIGPVMLFWLISAFAFGNAKGMRMVRNTIIILAVFESLLTLVQSWQGRMLVYESDYLTLYWFDPTRFNRWMGTTDSPLVLALLVCVAAPLTLGLRHSGLRLVAMIAMLLGAITSQSRFGVAVMCALLIYILIRGRMNLFSRILCIVLVAIAGRTILSSQLVSGISSRFTNDTGSTAARGLAWDAFVGQLHTIAFVGNGLTSNYRIATEAGLQTSLESSFLMYAVDVGLPLALLYFGSQILLTLRHGPRNHTEGAFIAAMIGISMQHTFSALGGSNLSGAVTWAVLGLLVAGTRRFDEDPDDLPTRVSWQPRYDAARRTSATSLSS